MEEKELLSVIETLKEHRPYLLGSPDFHIYTDNHNDTFECFASQLVLHWHLFLEECTPHFHHIKGDSNTLADALSCLLFDERQNVLSCEDIHTDVDDFFGSNA